MGQVISLRTGKPVETVVILATSPSDGPLPTLGELRACLHYVDVVRMIERNFFTATRSTDSVAVEIAKATLRHIRDLSDYAQARTLAAMYLRIATRPKPPGSAA